MAQVHALIQSGLGQPHPMSADDGPDIERYIRQLVDAGIRRMTVVLGPNGAGVRARVARLLVALPADLDLAFFEKRHAFGNAGALGEICTGEDEVLVCFADLAAQVDFDALIDVHRARGRDVTLASHYEHHPLTLGELQVDGDEVRGCEEKPRTDLLVCSGVAMFAARAMAVARGLPRPYGLSTLVDALLDAGCSVTHWLHEFARADDEHLAAPLVEPVIRRQAG